MDDLLQMMLPAKVISELIYHRIFISLNLFSGMTKFQTLSSICSAMDAVTFLNNLFKSLYNIAVDRRKFPFPGEWNLLVDRREFPFPGARNVLVDHQGFLYTGLQNWVSYLIY